MHLQGRHRRIGDVVVIELDGDADLASMPRLAQIFTRGLDAADRSVIIDLDRVTVLDDAALGLLVGTAATARRSGLEFALLATGEAVRGRLSTTRLDEIIDVLDRLPIADVSDPS